MRKRNNRIKFRLNEKEAEYLNKCVTRSGLSRSGYIRQLIDNIPDANALPPDYAAATEKLRPIAERINQIARKAHVLNVIERQQYDETLSMFNEAVAEIIWAVMMFRNFRDDEEQEKGHTQDENIIS